MNFKHLLIQFLLVLAPLLTLPGAQAVEVNDAAALRNVTQGNGVFLIDMASPNKTAFYLGIIKESYAGMLRQGVKPDFIIVYIGPTVGFLTTAPESKLEMEYDDALEAIAKLVQDLHKLGVRQEVCAIATKVLKVDDSTLLPGLTLVADGFISLIGWQTQGYKLVPLF